jgi:hypothetical protein
VVPNPAKPSERPRPAETKPPELPLIVRLLAVAREWQARIESREIKNQAEIARRSELSEVRVSNVLFLLRLHPAILAYIDGLQPGKPADHLTERWLRPITRLPQAEQLVAVSERLGVNVEAVERGARLRQ